jgi:uncharacterized protein YjiK
MTDTTTLFSTIALVAALLIGACEAGSSARAQQSDSLFAAASSAQWRLPGRLREISGLALSPDGRVFAHDDERAILYEIDLTQRTSTKSFALGDGGARGDFEGIAITPTGDFWLTTSRGRLYRFREGADGEHVASERFDTGLKDACEVEGLAYLASTQSLILACKTNYAEDMRDAIALYTWSPSGGRDAELWRSLPEVELTAAARVRHFRPSSVEIDPISGRILLLSANDGALAELGADGALLAARALGSDHVQAEGLTVTADGALLIADEGGGAEATMSLYERVND